MLAPARLRLASRRGRSSRSCETLPEETGILARTSLGDRLSVAEHTPRGARRREPARPEDGGGAFRDGAGRAGTTHVGAYPTWIGCVHQDAAGPELPREEPRQGVQRRLARSVAARHLVAEREDVVEGEGRIAQPARKRVGLAPERAESARHHHDSRPGLEPGSESASEEQGPADVAAPDPLHGGGGDA